jgi:hypothetical protein
MTEEEIEEYEEQMQKHCVSCQALGMQKAVDVMLSATGLSDSAVQLCWECNRILGQIGSAQSLRLRADVKSSKFGDRVSWYCEIYTDDTEYETA